MNDGSVIIDVEFNTDKARKQYQEFGNEAAQQLDNTIGKSKAFNSLSEQSVEFAKKASLSILAVGTAVAGFSIKSAADMQAMDAQFSQVFGNLEKNAQSSIDSISKETNILPNRLKPAFTSMAAFAKTTGMDTADALDLTSRATKAAADSAAFYDKSIDEVSESLQSYLKGNYENDAALGISSTETTRNAAANKLYGKSFNDLSEAQKQLTLLQMVEDGNKLSGALGQAAREGGGLENVIGNMKQAITDLGAAFGAPLLDPFLDIVQKVSGAMSKLAQVFRENPALVYVVVGAVTTLAAALGAAYLAANNFAKLKAIMSGVQAAFLALTSPISLVVLAIGALVTAFMYFYNTSEEFRTKVNEVWQAISDFIQPIVQAISNFIMNVWGLLVEWWNANQEIILLSFQSVWNGILLVIQTVLNAVVPFIMEIWGMLTTWWNENQQLILTTAQTIWGAIQVVFSTVMGAIELIVITALTAIQVFWNTWGSTIMALVKVAWATIKSIFQSTLSTIMSIVTGIMNQIQTIIKTVMGIIQGIIKVITGAIKGDWSQVWEGIKQIVVTIFNGIKDTISNVLETAKSIVSGKIESIKEFFTSIGDIDLYQIGKDIIQGLINGIGSMINAVKEKISEVASGIKDRITGFFDIHSPSRVMRDQVGKYIPEGIAEGIDKGAKTALDSMDDLSRDLMNATSGDFLNQIPAMDALISGSLKPEQKSTMLTSLNKPFKQTKENRNSADNTSLLSNLTDAIDKLANRPVEASFKIGEREIVKAIAQPVNQEILRIQRRQKRSQEGIT